MKPVALPEMKWCEVMLGEKKAVLHYYTKDDLLDYGKAMADAAVVAMLNGTSHAVDALRTAREQGAAP